MRPTAPQTLNLPLRGGPTLLRRDGDKCASAAKRQRKEPHPDRFAIPLPINGRLGASG